MLALTMPASSPLTVLLEKRSGKPPATKPGTPLPWRPPLMISAYLLSLTRAGPERPRSQNGQALFPVPLACHVQRLGKRRHAAGHRRQNLHLRQLSDRRSPLRFEEDVAHEQIWAGDDILSNHYATSVHHAGYLLWLRWPPGTADNTSAASNCSPARSKWTKDDFGAGTLTHRPARPPPTFSFSARRVI